MRSDTHNTDSPSAHRPFGVGALLAAPKPHAVHSGARGRSKQRPYFHPCRRWGIGILLLLIAPLLSGFPAAAQNNPSLPKLGEAHPLQLPNVVQKELPNG